MPPQRGTGSGFVIDKEGYIFTNYHVVEGADRITVKFHNDPKEYQARLVGAAPPLDVALLKVDAPKERLVPLVLGDSDQIRVGQKAIAMGNPFGLEFTVTQGIVSAIRENPGAIGDESGLVPQVIQTDAAINPGNSGGPSSTPGARSSASTPPSSPPRASSARPSSPGWGSPCPSTW